jgi:hypothetical protein
MPSLLTNIHSVEQFGTPAQGGTQASTTNAMTAGATAAMVKAVGGVQNWTKLFPAMVKNWTQVAVAQITAVEQGLAPSPLHGEFAPFAMAGQYTTAYFKGPKSGVIYLKATRFGGKLWAWYARNEDVARVIKNAIAHATPAQKLALQAMVAKAKAGGQGVVPAAGNTNFVPVRLNPGSIKAAETPTKLAIPPFAWYEVTPAFVLKVEQALPTTPSKAPIKLPKGPNFTAELLAGPKTRWPYAKVVASVNGSYITAWFTIGKAGKNKPGSIIFLKRPTVAGTTPTPVIDPTTTNPGSLTPDDLGDILAVPPGTLEMPPIGGVVDHTYPLEWPAGFGEDILAEGGETVEDIEWWKNPIYLGLGALVLAGGGYYLYRRGK